MGQQLQREAGSAARAQAIFISPPLPEIRSSENAWEDEQIWWTHGQRAVVAVALAGCSLSFPPEQILLQKNQGKLWRP